MRLSFFLAALLLAMPASGQDHFVPGEILVRFRAELTSAEIQAVVSSHGAAILDQIPELRIYRLALPQGMTVPEAVDLFLQDPACEMATPNYVGHGGGFLPDDTSFDLQWHLDNVGQSGGTPDADIDAVEGWQITRGSDSVIVAVLDSGIDSDHPEFQGRILPGYDFANDDTDPEDDEFHGTLVSGILAANADNGFAVAGVDHAAKILPVKVLEGGSGYIFDLYHGIVYAANQGADVINMSLIGYTPGFGWLSDAMLYAQGEGAVVVACAGNGGIGDADLSGPGQYPESISVGATTMYDERADFSGTGSALDLVAPGESVPTVQFDTHQDVITFFSGCSAATPIVSGIAALLRSIDPSLTHDEVFDILRMTAEDQVGAPSEDTPGRDDFFGYGRVNLNAALWEVAGLPDCSDGIDNDGDGFCDIAAGACTDGSTPGDPGCADPDDLWERSPLLICDDGADNDGDTLVDYPDDPGCRDAASDTERTACQDGYNNDKNQDPDPGLIDFDGGASLDLDGNGFIDFEFNWLMPAVTDPDPQCVGKPWRNAERKPWTPCGLGVELALLLPPLMWLSCRRNRRL